MRKIFFKLLFLAAVYTLLQACEQKPEQKKEAPLPVLETPEPVPADTLNKAAQLYEEVMRIHDRAMLKMSEIRKLSSQLNDSIQHTGVNPMYQEEAINMFRNRLKELKDADDAMRQWMRSFDGSMERMSEKEQMEYLEKEKKKMQEVEREMNKAISGAREALQE